MYLISANGGNLFLENEVIERFAILTYLFTSFLACYLIFEIISAITDKQQKFLKIVLLLVVCGLLCACLITLSSEMWKVTH